jgi:hypothetical protein
MSLQQQPVNQVGPNYPYNAYLDLLFDTEDKQELHNQLFIKDDPTMDDGNAIDGSNRGLWRRSKYISEKTR